MSFLFWWDWVSLFKVILSSFNVSKLQHFILLNG
jgi:hypothetical protein